MRALCFIVAMVLAGCGGSGGGAKTKMAKPEASDDAFAKKYCEDYRGCAYEKVQIALLADKEGGEAPPEAESARQVDEEIERCRGLVDGLTDAQQTWLESCTGCGGSCDVYDCMDRIPAAAEASKPFECFLGDQMEPEPPEENDESDKDDKK